MDKTSLLRTLSGLSIKVDQHQSHGDKIIAYCPFLFLQAVPFVIETYKRCFMAKRTHGLSRINGKLNPSYLRWARMKQRCYNPKEPMYYLYGGRGITVCDRWIESFENFHIDMGEPPTPEHSLDRIDNDKGYSPDNCRWATKSEQTYNRRPYERTKFRADPNREQVLRLHADGLSTRKIAAICGVGKTLVWKMVHGQA